MTSLLSLSVIEFFDYICIISIIYFLIISIMYKAGFFYYFAFTLILGVYSLIPTIIMEEENYSNLNHIFYRIEDRISMTVLFTGMTVIMLIAVFIFLSQKQWRQSHISAMSIKEAFNAIPEGICFYEENGLIRLANTKMDYLCMQLTGEILLNGKIFYNNLQNKNILHPNRFLDIGSENNPVIHLADNKTYRFFHKIIDLNGKNIHEIIAENITDEITVYRNLQRQNKELIEVNHKLREYGRNIAKYKIEQENLEAKNAFKNKFKELIDDTDSEICSRRLFKDSDIYMRWHNMLDWIENDVKLQNNYKPLEDLINAADIADVSIYLEGRIPLNNNNAMHLLMSGVRECLLDAIAAENVKAVFVRVKETELNLKIDISNDRTSYVDENKTGHGLDILNAEVVKAGGTMRISKNPYFRVIFEILRKGDDFFDSGTCS